MFKFWYDATMLSFEAQRVVGLRMMKLAGGGRLAQAEANRMVMEKIAASMSIAATLLSGGSGHAVARRSARKFARTRAALRGNHRPTRRLQLMRSRGNRACVAADFFRASIIRGNGCDGPRLS